MTFILISILRKNYALASHIPIWEGIINDKFNLSRKSTLPNRNLAMRSKSNIVEKDGKGNNQPQAKASYCKHMAIESSNK